MIKFKNLIITLLTLAIVLSFTGESAKAADYSKNIRYAKQSLDTQISDLPPNAKLAEVFNNPNIPAAQKAQIAKEQLRGVVVDWILPISSLEPYENTYVVKTPNVNKSVVGTMTFIVPMNDDDVKMLKKARPGDWIQFRGAIVSTSKNFPDVLMLDPAILIGDKILRRDNNGKFVKL